MKAAAGITFSVVLTESGKGESGSKRALAKPVLILVVVFAFGSEEKGQLGNGQAGERIVSAGKSAFDYETEPSESCFLMLVSLKPKHLPYA